MKKQINLFFIIIALGALVHCDSRTKNAGFETKKLTVDGPAGGPVIISAELARTDDQREVGLMYRKKLDEGKGMLFIFDEDERLSFWMKNTLLPLSIAFISSDGRILETRDMEPLDLNSVRSARPARFALEVPQGWFDKAGIGVGDRIRELTGGSI
jgi:uncharacterized membrane protein (UPF0127 family)